MNSMFSKHRWMQVMWGILLFVAGAITIIFAVTNKGDNVSLALSIALAVILFAYGLTIIFSTFLELKSNFFKYELVVGAFIVAIGVVFCLNVRVISEILVNTIAASFLTFGAVFLARAIIAISTKQKVWWMPLCFVLAALFIAGGVLCLIFAEKVTNICFIVFGAVLVIVGVIQVYLAVKRAVEANKPAIEKK